MKYIREASSEDPKAKHYIDILLSSVEYDTFVKLMRIMRPVAQQKINASRLKADEKGSSSPKGNTINGSPEKYAAASKDDYGGANDISDSNNRRRSGGEGKDTDYSADAKLSGDMVGGSPAKMGSSPSAK